MWLNICGASGTGKEIILKELQKLEFEIIPSFYVETEKTPFLQELMYFSSRMDTQVQASLQMDRKDVVTIRTMWESREIFVPISKEMDRLNADECRAFEILFKAFKDENFLPPTAIIYMKTEKMNALNRMKLRGSTELSQEEFNLQVDRYEQFVQKLRCPIIEIDISISPENIRKNLEFGLSSIRAANLTSRTIWTRTFFK